MKDLNEYRLLKVEEVMNDFSKDLEDIKVAQAKIIALLDNKQSKKAFWFEVFKLFISFSGGIVGLKTIEWLFKHISLTIQ